MISFTLENVLVLTVFQLVVSGLILCGTGAVFYLRKDSFVRKILTLFGLAFGFYSLHFLLRTVLAYRNLSLSSVEGPRQWEFLTQGAEIAALVCLGFAYLPQLLPERLGWRFWTVATALVTLLIASPYVVQGHWPAGSPGMPSMSNWINTVLLATVAALHLRRKGKKGMFTAAPLVVLSAAQFLRAASQGVGSPEWLWGAENAATLLALGLFAIVVDLRSDNLQVRFFLRLNLIFVAMASLLILIVAETERREYLGFAESHAEELCEFLRGHLIYFHSRGREPLEVLSSPEIIRKVTSEFGRLTDLRRVRVTFQGWQMEMSIAENWTVSHEVYPEAQPPRQQAPAERGWMTPLTPVPVVYGGQLLGRIELDESLRTINARVARQMRIIFLTFTVAVFLAAALFGFSVQHAHKTIQRQFKELERTHEQLAHAARLASAGQLAGGVAHEINNPAGIILTTSDYVLSEAERQGFPQSLREDLEAIRRQARRISDIVRGLLTFSRSTPLNMQRTQVNKVLQQSLALVTPRFREQRVHVENRLAKDLPEITADPDRLEQVFVNLLNNAVDALPDGGRVAVESAIGEADGHLCLVVSIADTGSGIPEEHLKSIFDPFFSTKPRGRGTGLGLAVSYGIIRDHGGQIQVESQVGRGTVFRVGLPVKGMHHEEL